MILELSLKNFAVVKEAYIEFSNGLNVLSGETGAGKTVIVSALNFVLGAKADKTLIRYGENYAEAQLIVDISKNIEAKAVLEDYGIENGDENLIIRRKITVEGKSDIRINGVSATLSMLKNLTLTLCDIYGQSEHYSLLYKQNQLAVLDNYVGQEVINAKNEIKEVVLAIKNINTTLKSFGGSESERAYKLDLLSYQINEISKANLVDGEEEELIEKKKLFSNVEKIGNALNECRGILGDDNCVVDMLNFMCSRINSISDFSQNYQDIADRAYNLKAEADDILSEVENSLDDVNFDEQDKIYTEERLDLIKSLKRKYGNSISEINEFLVNIEYEYQKLNEYEEISLKCNKELEKLKVLLNEKYEKLSQLRKDGAIKFSNAITAELKTLGMKSASFNININVTNNDDALLLNGIDDVEFTFSANAGEPLKSMSKIISGGEMSRFMLAMKIVFSSEDRAYIFDEIDAGISGEVARVVAEKFAVLSKNSQIITISHLPQIVSFADKSFKIEKTDDGVITTTTVLPLDENGKVGEVMRIIGGESQASKIHATELIEKANLFKSQLN